MNKRLCFFTTVILSSVLINGNAQVKVNQSGNVRIGAESTWTDGRLQVIDNNRTTEARIFATSADVARLWTMNQSYSYGFGLDADGMGRIYRNVNAPNYIMSFNSSGNVSIGSASVYSQYKLYVNGNFRVYGEVSCRDGYWANSDSRLKADILPIENALDMVMCLNGKTYTLKDANQKSTKDDVKYGLIAQEVKEIIPELVKETMDSVSYLSINYDGLIPILIEAIKEQQNSIDNLKRELDNLKQNSNSQGSVKNKTVGHILYQNKPNPFREETTIRYYLSSDVNYAMINIYDLQGTQIRSFKLQNTIGKSEITVDASSLKSGIYYYALIVDGKEIDIKRMMLTD